jgi:hypothetical protein
MTASYLLQLSPLEFHWLSDSFGMPRLPLIDDPLRHTPRSKLAAESKNAIASLESRGLINHASSRWQVDRLLATAITWLGTANSLLVIEINTREGSSHFAQVVSQGDVCMHVSFEDGKYQLLFLPGHAALSDHLFDQLGACSAKSRSAAQYVVSQPDTILRTVWKDATLASNMLRITGLETTTIKATLSWADSLNWVSVIRHAQIDDKKGTEQQIVLCGNQHETWSGTLVPDTDERFLLASMDKTQVEAFIKRFCNIWE